MTKLVTAFEWFVCFPSPPGLRFMSFLEVKLTNPAPHGTLCARDTLPTTTVSNTLGTGVLYLRESRRCTTEHRSKLVIQPLYEQNRPHLHFVRCLRNAVTISQSAHGCLTRACSVQHVLWNDFRTWPLLLLQFRWTQTLIESWLSKQYRINNLSFWKQRPRASELLRIFVSPWYAHSVFSSKRMM